METSADTRQVAIRIAGLAIFCYDYIITLTSEYRLYKRQRSKPSISCTLFAFVRYIGVICICWSTHVFFRRGGDETLCGRGALVGAVLRGSVAVTSALISLWCTCTIWDRNRNILFGVATAFVPVVIFSYVPGLRQAPLISNGQCILIFLPVGPFSYNWTFAFVNLFYFTLVAVLSIIPQIRETQQAANRVWTVLQGNGFIYYFLTLVSQAISLSFLLTSDISNQETILISQTILTSVLAQRLLISFTEQANHVSSNVTDPQAKPVHRSNSLLGHTTWPRVPPLRPIHAFKTAPVIRPQGSDTKMIQVEIYTDMYKHVDIEDRKLPMYP